MKCAMLLRFTASLAAMVPSLKSPASRATVLVPV
jgi:hypothetical protein